jgi:hypothetical protein
MTRIRLLLPLLALLVVPQAAAQPEIVPAEHAIYDFLHQQRVRGLLPEYRHEWRPLGRAQLASLLDSLRARSGGRVDAGTEAWLARFEREIHEPEAAIETVIGPGGRVTIPAGAETRKFLLYHRDDDWRIALSAIGRLQHRLASDGGERMQAVSFVPEGILEGNYRGIVGFYTGTFNGDVLTGDPRVLQHDPLLAPLYYVAVSDPPQGNFDRSTASVRVAGGPFSGEIAHARLMAGASFSDPLVLAENADYFSYLRAGIEGRLVQYAFMHGALGARARQIPGDEGVPVFVGSQRYLAFHRLTVNPFHWLQLAFSEAVVYANRGPELAYLNPVYPLKPAEHALWDQDNANFSLEAVVRPLAGVEAYGTVFVADLDVRKLGQHSFNNKWAVQAGVGGAIGPALGWLEYTRIEPFVYTHRFLLDGVFYNSYVHHEFGLGHPIGPNSDQWAAGLRGWLPLGVRGELQARYVRRGENYVDPETGEFVNVGGDIRDGRQPPFDDYSKFFLAGDRYEGPGLRARLTWEPIQDFALNVFADYQRWNRDEPNRLFVRSEIVIAF